MAIHKKSAELLDQVQEIINAYDFAVTLRQIYYQLVSKQIFANCHGSYQKLSRICVIGRDQGILDEDAFADRLRQIDKPSSWIDLPDFMKTVRRAYKKDRWINQDHYLEIWTEKDALRGVLTSITHYYDVSLLVVRGQVSRTAIYKAYERFSEKIVEGKNCFLYYMGDFDPSGISIYNSLVERLKSFGVYGTEIHYRRIALTPEQITQYNLPQDPAKKTDPNYKKFVAEYGDNVVELDALPPEVLRELIKECIEMNINSELLEQVEKIESREQKRLQKFIDQLSLV